MSLISQLLTTTCDIYRNNPHAGGATPDVTAVPCQLVSDYGHGTLQRATGMKSWTHYLLLDTAVDLRDGYQGNQLWNYPNADTVVIPTGGLTVYAVVFVEIIGRGSIGEHKRAYLDRQTPTWPDL
jgi:hypothetical protein